MTEDTADIALALMLAVERRIAEGDRSCAAAMARTASCVSAARCAGARSALSGSAASARRSPSAAPPSAWRSPITARAAKPECAYPYFADLVALAEWSEILVVAATGRRGAPGIWSTAAVLEALGPDGTLINIARGSVVDEAALVAALQSGALGARRARRVTSTSRSVPEALIAMENVVLMPHTGSATHRPAPRWAI